MLSPEQQSDAKNIAIDMEDDLFQIKNLASAIHQLIEDRLDDGITEPIITLCRVIQGKCDALEEQRRKAAGQVQS